MRPRLTLDAAQSAFVAERVQNFDREAAVDWQWQSDYVRMHNSLPVYLGWTETLAIQPDGFLVRWSTEAEYDGLKPIEATIDCALAMIKLANRYAILKDLAPRRPSDVPDCFKCAGTGRILSEFPEILCACVGLGWVPRSLRDLPLILQ